MPGNTPKKQAKSLEQLVLRLNLFSENGKGTSKKVREAAQSYGRSPGVSPRRFWPFCAAACCVQNTALNVLFVARSGIAVAQ
jgi:hypothetical protein